MATLKISEISVGDWVIYEDKIYKLYAIEECGLLRGVWEDSESIAHIAKNIDYFDPIPITAEILEKNGLVRHERDADNPKRVVLSNHFIMARTYTDADWWRVLIYDEELPSKELFNGIIYSVHQLQHALRLAGIDKEINL
jgi:hypothetical protein